MKKKKELIFKPLRGSVPATKNKPRTIRGVMARANVVDKHGDMFLPQALVGAAEDANGPFAIRQLIEHDRTMPPIGKLTKAWVEHQPDGAVHLVSETEIFETAQEIFLPDGTVGFLMQSQIDKRPFVKFSNSAPVEIELSVDTANFQDIQDYRNFIAETRTSSGVSFQSKNHSRKSHVPTPEIILQFGAHVAALISGTALGKKLIDKVDDKLSGTIAEDVDKLYRLVRSSALNAAIYMLPKNRPITYILTAAGEPEITFVVKTNKPDVVISATEISLIMTALEDVEKLNSRFNPTEIQYIWNGNKWEFNFLLTDTGAIIGTKVSLGRRIKSIIDFTNKELKDDVEETAEVLEADTTKQIAATKALSADTDEKKIILGQSI